MGSFRSVVAGVLGLAFAATTSAADGLSLNRTEGAEPWSRWQGRLSLAWAPPVWRSGLDSFEATGLKVAGWSLMGDYYFGRSLDANGSAGGFRATSGVVGGSQVPWWAGPPLPVVAGGIGIERGLSAAAPAPLDSDAARSRSWASPYLGVGYTGLAPRSGWSFSADLGVLAAAPAELRLEARLGGPSGGDAPAHVRRLAPVLQLGVSRSF